MAETALDAGETRPIGPGVLGHFCRGRAEMRGRLHCLISNHVPRNTVAELIVESYQNSTVNTILEDIGKKYDIDTSRDLLSVDSEIEEIKFKYRTYLECVKMLYRKAGL
jgi:hypothetical protein